MKSRISRWGNSLALRLPKSLAVQLGFEEELEVELEVEAGRLLVKPVLSSPTLEELLAGVTEENLHQEVDWGPPVGQEPW